MLEMVHMPHGVNELHAAKNQCQEYKRQLREDNNQRRTDRVIVGEGDHLIASAIDFFLSCFFCMRLPFAVSLFPRIAPMAFIVP
jgi:hypothetical protein